MISLQLFPCKVVILTTWDTLVKEAHSLYLKSSSEGLLYNT